MQVLAYTWDYMRRFDANVKGSLDKAVERTSDHNQVLYQRKPSPVPKFSDRDFFSRQVWRKENESDTFIIVCAPIGGGRPVPNGVVRGRAPITMKITGNGDETVVEYMIQLDFNGFIGSALPNRMTGIALSGATRLQEYFQGIRGLDVWDEADGRAVGEALVIRTEEAKAHGSWETKEEARVRVLVEKQKGLREMEEQHPWFGLMLARVVRNKIR